MPATTRPRRPAPVLHDHAWVAQLQRRLLAWFDRHARDLPWRRTRDPYAVWVSEVMLQQTQVATVESYYRRFLAALPNIERLAAAHEQQVLRLWEGLGYYRRARQMHRAAQVLVERHGGRFPTEAQAVQALPGIGRYTAGAILSIAFDQRQPILEANTLRLLSRLLALRADPRSTAGQAALWQAAEAWLPRRKPGRFNQALMELGALVCTPRTPQCHACPLAELCPVFARGWQERIPPPAPRPQIERVDEAAVVVRRAGRVLLALRGPEERWAGMWDFPRFSHAEADSAAARRTLASHVRHRTGIACRVGSRLTVLHHSVTRFRITLHVYDATTTSQAARARRDDLRWVTPDELAGYGLHVTARKIARLLR